MLQLSELCRLCAQKKRHKLDLFAGLIEEETRILLAKISLCLSINVTKEDLLPKMICFDCQKAVEQFNAYRVKCHKAEERLNKMLSAVLPNKVNIPTRIKQESSEPDFHDINIQMKVDSPKCNEALPFVNLKSVNNVKSEFDDLSNEFNEAESTQLIKIISEEIVNKHKIDDIKQPHIEIVSENYNEEFKISNISETSQIYSCDIKIIPETLSSQQQVNTTSLNINSINQINSTVVPDIKGQDPENVPELINDQIAQKRKTTGVAQSKKKRRQNKKKPSKDQKIIEDEPEEKYLTLKEGEVCDIDLEEMGALIRKKENPNSQFQCNKCNKLFKSFKCFKKHKKWHDSEPDVFICDFCKNDHAPNFTFSSYSSLNVHIQRKHLSSKSYDVECHFCTKTLSSVSELRAHYSKVHDKSRVSCKLCGKDLKNQYNLTNHLRVHQEEKPYECDLCGQTFKWRGALKTHITWHKQEKNFLCSECGKKFTTKKNLIEHLNIHSGKKPYTCDICNGSFAQFSAYSKHLYMHNENSRIHKCDKCKKAFSHAFLLKRHLIRHTGIRPFKCSTCQSSFKSQADLSFHTKIHQEKQYGCNVCGKKFAALKTLRDHMVQHTGIKHICPIPGCEKTYVQRFALTKHFLKQHPSYNIIKKKGGRKAQVLEDSKEEQQNKSDFIRYDFEEKGSKGEGQVEPIVNQYNLEKTELNLVATKTPKGPMMQQIKHVCPIPGCGKTYTQRFTLTKHFLKLHPSYSMLKTEGRKRPQVLDDSKGEKQNKYVFINYEFKEKKLNSSKNSEQEHQPEPVLIQCNLETGLNTLENSEAKQQTEPVIIQYNLEETGLDLLESSKNAQQTDPVIIQYNLEETGLNLLDSSKEEQQTEPVLIKQTDPVIIQYNLEETGLNLLDSSKEEEQTEPVLIKQTDPVIIQYNLEETGLNLLDSSKEEEQTEPVLIKQTDPVIIQYNLEEPGMTLLKSSKKEQQTGSFIIQYNVEEAALNLLESSKEEPQAESLFIQYEFKENGLTDDLNFG